MTICRLTFNTTCLCVFGSVNSFPVDSPCPYPRYHPAEPFRQLLSIDWLVDETIDQLHVHMYRYYICLHFIGAASSSSSFCPFNFHRLFSLSLAFIYLSWTSMQPPLERGENWREKEIKIEKWWLKKKESLFEEFSILKSQGEKNGAMSRRRRRRTLRRCRPREFFLACMRARSIVSKGSKSLGKSRSVPEVVPGSRRVSRDRRPRSRDIFLRHVLCDAIFPPASSPFSLATRSNNDVQVYLRYSNFSHFVFSTYLVVFNNKMLRENLGSEGSTMLAIVAHR